MKVYIEDKIIIMFPPGSPGIPPTSDLGAILVFICVLRILEGRGEGAGGKIARDTCETDSSIGAQIA